MAGPTSLPRLAVEERKTIVVLSEFMLGIVVAAAAYFDLRERRIPNWLTLPGLVIGLLLHATYGGTAGLISGLTGAVAGAALLILPFALGWMGGGDLKLLAAVGALMGVSFTLTTLLFALAAGGIIAVVWLAIKGSLLGSLKYMILVWLPASGAKPAALKTSIPFGPALGLGAIVALFWH